MTALALTLAVIGYGGYAAGSPAEGGASYLDQGWSQADREVFYTTSQGSEIIPLAWLQALRRLDTGAPFLDDQLQRYGYLGQEAGRRQRGLPIGFVVTPATAMVGMTCAACHTGQVEYEKAGVKAKIRIDGAPAKAVFQQFLEDLDSTAAWTLADAAMFDTFAHDALGAQYSPAQKQVLKVQFAEWAGQFHQFMAASLPAKAWGPGRLDAFGMIFNRVAARDLGLPQNFRVADAPVRYPFLWNSTKQDKTQWNGAVPNGLYIEGLARNTGEAMGVFATFKPSVVFPGTFFAPTQIHFKDNSVRFGGLQSLEEAVAKLKPPPWPKEAFGFDPVLAAAGKPLFQQNCAGCHEQKPSSDVNGAWATKVLPVGTDPKMALNAGRLAETGLYRGASRTSGGFFARFSKTSSATDILQASVIGSMLDEALLPPSDPQGVWRAVHLDAAAGKHPPFATQDASSPQRDPKAFIQAKLGHMYQKPVAAPGAAYEARVLQGAWAAAPYLHNGSVPNLWELLTDPALRTSRFMVGSRTFDPVRVGFSTDASPFSDGSFVTDPSNLNGDGNLGHAYGTSLSPSEKWALIEYVKSL